MTPPHKEDWKERIYTKYQDKGDERFGLVKHNNTILKNIIDDCYDEFLQERSRIVKLLEGKKKEFSRNNYDGDDLNSACNFYRIGALNWCEILRFEDGANKVLDFLLSEITTEKV